MATTGSGSGEFRTPADLQAFIQRSHDCGHFAGEFGGDHSARDAQVTGSMNRLHCDRLATDLRTMRLRYRDNANLVHRLATFDDDGLPADGGTD